MRELSAGSVAPRVHGPALAHGDVARAPRGHVHDAFAAKERRVDARRGSNVLRLAASRRAARSATPRQNDAARRQRERVIAAARDLRARDVRVDQRRDSRGNERVRRGFTRRFAATDLSVLAAAPDVHLPARRQRG